MTAAPPAPAPSLPLHRRCATLLAGVIAGGLFALALLVGVAWVATGKEYRMAVDEVLAEIERSAGKLATRTTEVFDRVDQTTQLIKYLKERDSLPPLNAMQEGGLLANDVARLAVVADAHGAVVDSSAYAQARSIAGTDAFEQHRQRNDLGVRIGPTGLSALTDGWTIPVSRRLNDASGNFAGVVASMVDPQALAAGYARTEAQDTAVGVLRLDGVFLSRLLGGRVTFGERLDVAAMAQRTGDVRRLRRPVTSGIDGTQRFVTHVRLERYPLIVVVAVNADTALAGYRHARNQILGWAASLGVLIVAGVALLWLRIRELEESRRRTYRAEAAFRATLEGSMDAVTLLRSLRDDRGRLLDMVIVDTNERAACLHGGSREQVLGRALCSLRPSLRREGYLARFEQVICKRQTASLELQTVEPPLTGRWLHHQIVPLDDGVALITRDVTERKEAERRLAGLARLDPLTQLSNRRDFEQRLAEAEARARRSRQTLALLYVDLDGFKDINDTLGHAAGDQVLVGVASRLRQCVRLTDNVSRLGGDEFTVLMEAAGSVADVTMLCERILAALCLPYPLGSQTAVATPSIGAALLRPGETATALQQRADAAMYQAKRLGKARFWLAGSEVQAVAPAAPEPVLQPTELAPQPTYRG